MTEKHFLDITGDVCPMTWVKTRLELEDLEPGDVLSVRVRAGDSHYNVETNARVEGHEILADEAEDDSSQDDGAPDDGAPDDGEGIRVLLIRRGD